MGRMRLMNLQKTTDLSEQFTFNISPLIRKNFERASKPDEEFHDYSPICYFSRLLGEWQTLNPLRETVHYH